MNAEKLIEELRKVYEYYFDSTVVHPSGLNVRMMAKNCADKLEEMKDELAKAKRRADKAVDDLNALRKKSSWICFACKYDMNYVREVCAGCDYNNDNNWRWRGDAEDGENEREAARDKGCEYCDDDCCPRLNWHYGLAHILPGYKYCPMCGRKLDHEPKEAQHE